MQEFFSFFFFFCKYYGIVIQDQDQEHFPRFNISQNGPWRPTNKPARYWMDLGLLYQNVYGSKEQMTCSFSGTYVYIVCIGSLNSHLFSSLCTEAVGERAGSAIENITVSHLSNFVLQILNVKCSTWF